MKLLTVHQPWADLIVSGDKPFENRSWSTRYRGKVAILAGLSRKSLGHIQRVRESVPAYQSPGVFGFIIGVADLVDVLDHIPDHPFASGPFCWKFMNPVRLTDPIPMKGCLGLVSLPLEIQRQVELVIESLQPA